MQPISESHDEKDPFLIRLHDSRLLSPTQLRQVEADLRDQADQCPDLANILVHRGWLTQYQVEQILAGNGPALRLGQYRILEPISTTGTGAVYKAEHVLMKRLVALKIITEPSLHSSGVTLLNFLREVQSAAQLQHPNIVLSHDAGEERGRLYLIMEYVDGLDLHQLVSRRGALPVGIACELIRQAARGLQYAHEQHMVHRDIKPSNLIVTLRKSVPSTLNAEEGSIQERLLDELDWPLPASCAPWVKLLDLGLACRVGTTTGKIAQSHLVGTPDYLAPELAEPDPQADIRSDLYSLGCTFYQLLTGEVPYPGDSWTEKVYAHRFDPIPPLEEKREGLAPEVVALVERLMAKDPQDRPETPAEVADALEQWLQRNGAPDHVKTSPMIAFPNRSRSQRSSLTRKAGQVALAMVLGIMLALAARMWLSRPDLEAKAKASESPPIRITRSSELPEIRIERNGQPFSELADAIHAAQDGDVLVLSTKEPITTGPIRWKGKALTLRAASGQMVELRLSPSTQRPWDGLLTTDRNLHLLDLKLVLAEDAKNATAPLIHCEGAELRMERCELVSSGMMAPILCRDSSRIRLEQCQASAARVGISVEAVKGPRCRVELLRTELTLSDPDGVGVLCWGNEDASFEQLHITLEECQAKVGRMLAFRELTKLASLHIDATENRFECQQALLGFTGLPAQRSWRKTLHWNANRNQIKTPTFALYPIEEPRL